MLKESEGKGLIAVVVSPRPWVNLDVKKTKPFFKTFLLMEETLWHKFKGRTLSLRQQQDYQRGINHEQ